jgi:hypothetical protein
VSYKLSWCGFIDDGCIWVAFGYTANHGANTCGEIKKSQQLPWTGHALNAQFLVDSNSSTLPWQQLSSVWLECQRGPVPLHQARAKGVLHGHSGLYENRILQNPMISHWVMFVTVLISTVNVDTWRVCHGMPYFQTHNLWQLGSFRESAWATGPGWYLVA